MLSKQTIERIEQEARDKFTLTDSSTFNGWLQSGYIAGATAEATRHEQERKELVEVLADLVALKEYKEENGKDEYYEIEKLGVWNEAKATLLKYKNK